MHIHFDAKLVYLETPKTATVSTHMALKDIGFVPEKGRLLLLLNEEPEIRRGHHVQLDHHLEDPWLTFSTVRNPFDILVSWYHHVRRYNDIWLGQFTEEFIEQLLHKFHRTKYLFTDKESLFGLHMEYTKKWIRFENLNEELNEILVARDLPEVTPEHLHASPNREHKNYRLYYTPKLRAYVEKKFKKDFDQFGYTF